LFVSDVILAQKISVVST